ncbi:MAG: hypothetical protein MHM6MM_004494 [Cercozoa sp. M6MM]
MNERAAARALLTDVDKVIANIDTYLDSRESRTKSHESESTDSDSLSEPEAAQSELTESLNISYPDAEDLRRAMRIMPNRRVSAMADWVKRDGRYVDFDEESQQPKHTAKPKVKVDYSEVEAASDPYALSDSNNDSETGPLDLYQQRRHSDPVETDPTVPSVETESEESRRVAPVPVSPASSSSFGEIRVRSRVETRCTPRGGLVAVHLYAVIQ